MTVILYFPSSLVNYFVFNDITVQKYNMASDEEKPEEAHEKASEQTQYKGVIVYLIDKFTTREHFMRAITTYVLTIAAYQSIVIGEVHDHWLIMVGTVVGYYFKIDQSKTERNG